MATAGNIVGIQIDLKYLMPRKTYLLDWLRQIAAMGINSLLLEYEDKFPFQKYPFLQAPGAFTPAELRQFLGAARALGIQVIPLVQTLSHLEFALNHPQLAHLRELPEVSTQINPANPQAVALVHDLIDEVMAYHQEDTYFHLGGDEAWHMGHNPANKPLFEKLGKVGYWAQHLKPLLAKVIAAGKRPMLWDDTFWAEPAAVGNAGLPKETVLVTWNYGIRKLKADSLGRVEHYRKAGYDVLAAPCLNWGVLYPMYEHCLENTEALAQKCAQSGLQGMLNTSWSCFHTPLPTQALFIAATAQAMAHPGSTLQPLWQAGFFQQRFGVAGEQWPNALSDLSANHEVSCPGLARPLTLVGYGYMDMVLYFRNIEERMARGSYPLDWREVDFTAMRQRKFERLAALPEQEKLAAKLDELETRYQRAAATLARLAPQAISNQDEAALLALLAEMKLLHVKVSRYHLFQQGNRDELVRQAQAQGPQLAQRLSPFYEDVSVQRYLEIWTQPVLQCLEQTAAVPAGA